MQNTSSETIVAKPSAGYFALAAAIGATTFGAALAFQYVGGLAPCQLCLWQRYALAVGIGAAVLAAISSGTLRFALGALAALGFAAEAALAAYHTGVERQWWAGPSGCSGGALPETFDPAAMLAGAAGKAPPACNEIPWSLAGLSMANWNVLIAGLMMAICIAGLRRMHAARGSFL